METVGSHEAKTHLARLLERVAQGERITITKHGVAVAELVPAGESPKRDAKEVIEEIKRLRKGRKLGRTSIRRLVEERRRY